MGKALYRKYRSKQLSEIIGQEHITTTLEQALKSGKISHAYLFTGPRGVGKTSIARIWAHEINNLPYEDDSMHLDIIEIDAASNRRIDEIRDLRDKVHVAPTSAKYKVYIIDEVHMLTREAFNALLKTLEEPPAHAVFILATTDAHKLPETIISRTQRFTFRPVEQAKVVAHLRTIADAESITISDDALGLLAQHGEGSFRDSISMLDQASTQTSSIEIGDIQAMLGIAPKQAIEALLESITTAAPTATIMQQLDALYLQGFQAAALAQQLSEAIRNQLVNLPTAADQAQLDLLAALIEVPVAHNPERLLEISLLRQHATTQPALPSQPAPEQPTAKSQSTKHTPKPAEPKPEPDAISKPQAATPEPEPQAQPTPESPKPESVLPANSQHFDETLWPQILEALKKQYNTLYGVVRMAQPTFSDTGTLQLHFTFAFHQKRINEAGNRQILMTIIQDLTGEAVTIECLYSKDRPTVAAKASETVAPTKDSLKAVSNIFGGGELLES